MQTLHREQFSICSVTVITMKTENWALFLNNFGTRNALFLLNPGLGEITIMNNIAPTPTFSLGSFMSATLEFSDIQTHCLLTVTLERCECAPQSYCLMSWFRDRLCVIFTFDRSSYCLPSSPPAFEHCCVKVSKKHSSNNVSLLP